jgi:hypothetical protein
MEMSMNQRNPVSDGIVNECHRVMAFMAERMNALGETSKEATRKVIDGDKNLTLNNAFSGWAKECIRVFCLLVDDQDFCWRAKGSQPQDNAKNV